MMLFSILKARLLDYPLNGVKDTPVKYCSVESSVFNFKPESNMGNSYCIVCGNVVDSGKSGQYCDRCYKREYPSCGHCKKALLPNQEIVGNYHKFPCYSQKSSKCCQCDAPVDYKSNGTYCKNCYDSKHPPPVMVHLKSGSNEIKHHMRADDFKALSDGRQKYLYLMDS